MPPTVRWLLLLATLLLPLHSAAADNPYVRAVTVSAAGRGFVCDAVLFAPVRLTIAFDVLTDVDHMVDWVPNLRQSRLLRREGDVAYIEQVGLAQFGFLSFNFTTERRLELNRPVSIKATQIRGDARRYDSLLRLSPEENGTRIVYRAQFEPGLLASLVVSREFLEHEIAEQFNAMVAEMVRRQVRATLTPGPSGLGLPQQVGDPRGEGSR